MIVRGHLLLIAFIGVLLSAQILSAQESWQKIAPVGMTFTISMPGPVVDSPRRIIWNDEQEMVLVNMYQSATEGKRYLAGQFFKASAKSVARLANPEDFVGAIEHNFSTPSRPSEVQATLTNGHDLSLPGYVGREYRIEIWKYPGVLRLIGNDKTFYVLMAVGANERDAQRFFSSFAVGDVNTNVQASDVIPNTPPNDTRILQIMKTAPPSPWMIRATPINGGLLNGKAVSLPAPEYPGTQGGREAGEVSVNVVIDELGNVIWAKASEAQDSLRQPAEAAAWKAHFSPTKLMGQPIKISGRIVYNFANSTP
jgi:hypothetical protein